MHKNICVWGFLSTLSLRRATGILQKCGHELLFLSTLSLRRATNTSPGPKAMTPISIHALLAESDGLIGDSHPTPAISIHALLAESDLPGPRLYPSRGQFLSTLSLRRATRHPAVGVNLNDISIHALLAESDPPRTCPQFLTFYFYPRSPCGERPAPQQENGQAATISIHALLAESDQHCPAHPTSAPVISIHALLAESDSALYWFSMADL